jgi:phosphoadenosine phosphosulfate reductase
MRPELQKKIEQSINLLKKFDNPDNPVEIAYSCGKDSDVILQLAKEAGIAYRAIYRNTTIDPPGTIMHAREMGVEVRDPKEGKRFFQLVAQRGYPSRFVRFCCSELKEYKIRDKCVIGVRREESRQRNERYKEPTACLYYGRAKTEANHVEAIYPILEWTLNDVAEFIQDRKIKCAPVYYDNDGTFHPERRLGCIACPLAYKTKRIEEFKKYHGILHAYLINGKRFLENKPDSKIAQNYHGDVYEYFTRCLFYDSDAEMRKSEGGLFDEQIDYKAFLEKQFNIKL